MASPAQVTLAGQRRRDRRGLLATTALQAGAVLVLAMPALPARAQAPNARPAGGTVVAGQASIGQTTARTTVAQSSQRAAVDWTSYDIGSNHTVVYQQPNSSSITLNRVTGPNPSEIAGRIAANGQVVIVNGSGVVFHAGSQVDVQSLVVSSANVTNRNFMAGRMVFDQPGRPDAKISNAGTITVRETGLAALVAPQVANTGTITARMGHVVLAGGEAHTVDLYGDGLMSVDVTREVRQTPAGQTALVTNTGTVVADGGTIVLTAKAADGIVQNLVSAKGRLQANSIGDRPGTVVVAGIGGSVTIEGRIEADGHAPGTVGGTIQLAATNAVRVAAGAHVSANGHAGGGTVAIGTTPARALAQGTPAGATIPAGTARTVRVAAGARIAADATGSGNGGTVALLSTANTTMNGAITARGGRSGGDGGRVEVSSAKTIGIGGTVDTTAPFGRTGTLLLDPGTLNIGGTATDTPPVTDNPDTPGPDNGGVAVAGQTITATTFNAFQSDVKLQATDAINLVGTTPLTQSHNVTLTGTGTAAVISVSVGLSTTGTGTLTLIGGLGEGGRIDVNAALSSATTLSLAGSTLNVNSTLAGANRVSLQADTLNMGATSLVTTTNGIVAIAPLATDRALTVDAVKQEGSLSIATADLVHLVNPASAPSALILGDVSLTPSVASAAAGSLSVNTPLVLTGATALGLYSNGAVTIAALSPVTSPVSLTLAGSSVTVNSALSGTNRVSFQADTLTLNDGASVATTNGIVAVAPATGTRSLTVDATKQTNSLSLTQADLDILAHPLAAPARIVLGDVSLAPSAATATAATVVLNTSLDLATPGTSLGLYAKGDITQTAGIIDLGNASAASFSAGAGDRVLLTRANILPHLATIAGTQVSLGLGASVTSVDGTLTATTVTGKTGNGLVTLRTGGTLDVAGTGGIVATDGGAFLYGNVVRVSGTVQASAVPVAASPAGTGVVSITGNTIQLQTGATITAGGRLDLAQQTGNLVVGTGGNLVIDPAATLTAPVIRLGQAALSNGGTPTPGTASTGITFNSALNVAGRTLDLESTGDVTQAAGARITAGSLTGTAQAVKLGRADTANAISGIGTFTSTGDFTLNDGATALGLTGNLTVGAVATPHTLSITAGSVTQSTGTGSGIVTADTLALKVGDASADTTGHDVTLNAANRINTLGAITVAQGDLQLTDAQNLVVAGAVTGRNVLVKTTNAGTLAVNGTIGACAIDDNVNTGTLTLAAAGTLTFSGTAGGERSTLLSGSTIEVNDGAFVLAGRSATPAAGTTPAVAALAGTLTFSDPLTLGGGTVAASTVHTNGVQQSGGTLVASVLTTTGYGFTAGTLVTGSALTVSADGIAAGSLISAGGLTVNATGSADSTFASAGSLHSSADLHIVVPGSFNQSAGTIAAAGRLTIAGNDAGTAGAAGSIAQSAGATLAAGGTMELYGLGTVPPALAGSLYAASVQVLAPNADVTFQPGALGGAPAITAPLATLSLHCPGCDATLPNVTVAMLGVLPSATAAAPDLRLDGNTLSLPNAITAGTLELHSAGGTTATAILTATTLTGTAGYAANTAGLPTYTVSAGTNASATFSAANQIANLANYKVAPGTAATPGDFTLKDARPLTVLAGSTVTANDVKIDTTGGLWSITVNGNVGACATGAATGGAVTLTAGNLLTIAGTVGGERTTVLNGASGIAVKDGAFVEAGRSASAGVTAISGTVTFGNDLALSGGVVAADTVTAAGITQTGGTLVAPTLTTTGSYTFSGGTAQTTGDLVLASSGIAAGSLVSANTLTVNATGTAADTFNSAGTLYAATDLHIVLPGSFSQTAGTIGAAGAVTIAGNAAGTVGAAGTIAQSGGTIAAGTSVELYALGTGAVTMGGTLAAPSVQVLQPGADLTLSPTTLAGAATFTAPGYTVSLHCPGCDATPRSLALTGLVVETGKTADVRLDGLSLALAAPFTAGTLELHAGQGITQTGAFTATTLSGTAGYTATTGLGLPTYTANAGNGGSAALALLTAAGAPANTIANLGPFTTSGDLAVASAGTLTVTGQLVAGIGRSVALTAPGLAIEAPIRFGSITGGGFVGAAGPSSATAFDRVALQADALAIDAAIVAPGGQLSIAPLTGQAITVDAIRTAGLSLTQADLNNIFLLDPFGGAGPQRLQLGSLDGTTRLATAITLNAGATLTGKAATLGLYATGDITEAAGAGIAIGRQAGFFTPAVTGTITGASGGTVRLGTAADATPANSFDVLAGFTAANGFSVSNAVGSAGRSGLRVTGTVSSGTGDLGLLDVGTGTGGIGTGGTIAIAGTLDATGHTLTLAARDGAGGAAAITTAAGSVLNAATLTGSARTTAAGTGYDVLLDGGTNRIGTLSAFTVGTPSGTGTTPQGAFRLTDAATTDLLVTGPVVAKAVTLTTDSTTATSLTVTGSISALTAEAGTGTVSLVSKGGVALPSGTVGGQSGVTVSAPLGLSITGGTLDAPTVSLVDGTALTLTAGALFGDTVTVAGTASQTGGVLHAATTLTTGGLSFSNGDLYAGNGLTFSVPGGTLAGSAVTPGNMVVTGTDIASTGLLLAGGTLGVTDAGTFSQTGGTVASGKDLTVAAADVVNQSGGAMRSGGTLLLRGRGADASAITGQLSGATIQVAQPLSALTFAPVAATGDHALGGAATVTAGSLVNTYLPGAQTTTLTGTTATSGANRPAGLLLDGATLVIGAGTTVIAADAIELHSAGSTSQGGGSLETSSLTGTAGYAGTNPLAGLPAYAPVVAQTRLSPGDAGYTAPGYTAADAPAAALATVTLTQAANNIARIDGYQVRGDAGGTAGLTVIDAPASQTDSAGTVLAPTGLTLAGVVRAGPGTDPLDASVAATSGRTVSITTTGAAGALTVDGTLAGSTITLATSGAVTQTGGAVVADMLTASGPSIALGGANQVATLGPVTATTGDIVFGNSRNLQVAGVVSAPNGTVAITARDGSGTAAAHEPGAAATGDLTIAVAPGDAPATVTGRSVQLTGVDVILNGTVGACDVAGIGGDVTVTATTGTIAVQATATTKSIVGGQRSLTLLAPGGVNVTGGTLDAPTLTIGSTAVPTNLSLSSGRVFGQTVTVTGNAKETGGLLAADVLTVSGTFSFSGGDLYTGSGGITLTVPTGPLTGTVSTGGPLVITGTGIDSQGSLLAAGAVTITDGGTFTQSAGSIVGAGVAITAAGLIDQTGGAILSTGTLLLRASGTGAATIAGQLAGTTIQVVEPAATLAFAPAVFAAGDTHPLRGGATIGTSAQDLAYTCPGCTPLAANTLTLTVASGGTPGANRPGTLLVDGGTVALGSGSLVLAADAVELHSLGRTYQAGGSLEAGTLTGTAGYAITTPGTIPEYAPPPAQLRAGDGSYVAAAPVTGATVTLDAAANNIAVIGVKGYQVRGDDTTRQGLTLVDRPAVQVRADGTTQAADGLLLTGTVRAGPASDPADATAAGLTGNDLTIRVTGTGQSLQIGSAALPLASVGGRRVTLAATGDIAEGPAGATGIGGIVADTLSASAGGSIRLATVGGTTQPGNQVATLANATATAGSIVLQDSRSLVVTGPVSAATGLTIVAQNGAGTPSVAEGASAGNLTLAGTLATQAGDASLTAYGTLSGSGVSAPGTVRLLAGGDVNVSGLTAGVLTGAAGRSFTASGTMPVVTGVTAAAGALIITDTTAFTLNGLSSGATGVVLTAPGMTLAGDLYSGADLRLRTTGAGITQTGGTVAAVGALLLTGGGDTTAMPGSLVQTAGTMAAGGSLLALVTGDATQAAAGTVAAPAVRIVSLGGLNDFGASQSASVTPATVTVSLAGIVPAFTAAPGSVTLSGRPATLRLDGRDVTLVRPVAADTVELHAAANLSESAGGSIAANLLTGTAGYAASGTDAAGLPTYATLDPGTPGSGAATLLSGGNLIGRLGDFQARSGLQLLDGTSLVVGGTVRGGIATDPLTGAAADATGAPVAITLTGTGSTLTIGDAAAPGATLAGSTVTLVAPGAITEAAGALIAAGTLSGSAASAALAPGNGGNQVVRLGAFTTAGDLAFANNRDLVVTGAVLAGPNPPTGTTPLLGLTVNGAVDLNGGSLTAGTVTIAASGALTETAGSIVANALTLSAAQVTANSAGNDVAVLTAATAPGGLAFTDAGSLVTEGAVTAANGPITLRVGGDLRTEGTVSAGGAVTFDVGGSTTVASTSTVAGASVTDTSRGTATIAGTVTTGGAVGIAANGLDVSGTVSGAALTLAAGTGPLIEAASGRIVGASLSATAGDVVALAGSVSVDGALGIAGNGVTLAGTSTVRGGATTVDAGPGGLTQLGSLTTTGDLKETAGGAATLAGTLDVGGRYALSANGITIAPGTVATVRGGPATLSAGAGAIVQDGTLTVAGLLTERAAGPATLAGTVDATGGLSLTANGVTFTEASKTTAAGTDIEAGSGALVQAGSLTARGDLALAAAGPATLSGTTTATGAMVVTANGAVLSGQTSADAIKVVAGSGALDQSGTLTASTAITGTAGTTVTLRGTTYAGSVLALQAGQAVTLAGTETAPLITTAAPSITLANGRITTGGVAQTRVVLLATLPVVRTARTGLFLEAGSQVVQSGETIVSTLSGSPFSTVRIDLTGGTGSILLANLNAPTTNLILDIGGGVAGGTIAVNSLTVIRSGTSFVSTGSANLLGSVGGFFGTAAAGVSQISEQGRDYRINSCAIGSVNCVILQPQTVPVGDPLKELVLNFFRATDDQDDLLLPNVTDQGL